MTKDNLQKFKEELIELFSKNSLKQYVEHKKKPQQGLYEILEDPYIRIIKDKFNVDVRSIVFPRNHVRQQYVDIAKRLGINCVRTNPNSYKLSHNKVVVWFYRIIRAIDTYFPICGVVCFNETKDSNRMVYTGASRYLRQFSKIIAVFEKI